MLLTASQLKPLFANWAKIMYQQKDHLIELDSLVGDGDLGLTMSDGFAAAYNAVNTSQTTDIGQFFYQAGKAMSTAVPSTMGTLMASGLMQIGKTFKGREQLDTQEFAQLFEAFFTGVQQRGKANIGEKTFLDGLYPAIETLKRTDISDWVTLARLALTSAEQGVAATKSMLAIHGRAATRGENSRSLLDPGAYVAQLLIDGYRQFTQNDSE